MCKTHHDLARADDLAGLGQRVHDDAVGVGQQYGVARCIVRYIGLRLGRLVDSADDLKPEWFHGKRRVGLTAGASAPEILVQQVIERLRALGAVSVRKLDGVDEKVHFPLPKGLGDKAMGQPIA